MADPLGDQAQRIAFGGMEPLCAVVPRMTDAVAFGEGAPAQPRLGLDDDKRDAQPRQRQPRANAGRASANDDDLGSARKRGGRHLASGLRWSGQTRPRQPLCQTPARHPLYSMMYSPALKSVT